ncbi:MAG: type II toxin-antitoxin system VapB family antitoxin [Thermoanaerobaculia bacterium]|nr:type II toxin-antitoxin system VapB family antitoxin [Thermoanaerobaculia bacterium]
MHSRKTSVEIDEQLLAAAQRILATRTIRETIEAAFRELVRAQARRDEVSALTTMEGLDLADPEIMAGAWRA